MIPKVIHRMWLDRNIDNNTVYPEKYDKFTQSFDKLNPEFTVEFWNNNRVNKLFDDHPAVAKYKSVWKNLPHHIQKCDVARYAILYIYGGVYVDLDFMFYKNISPLLDRELLLVEEPAEHTEAGDPFETKIFNGFIGSVPRHPFWLDWLDFIVKSLDKTDDVFKTSGPHNFRVFFDQSKYNHTKLVSACEIIPIHFYGKIANVCLHRNNGSESYGSNYYETFGNYADTKWADGTGWGDLTLDSTDNNNDIFSKRNCYILISVLIIILVILLSYLCVC